MKGVELIDAAISGQLGNCMITGATKDGSDAKLFQGFYVSPCGRYWGNKPFKRKRTRGFKKVERLKK